jgi:hypothetical protein
MFIYLSIDAVNYLSQSISRMGIIGWTTFVTLAAGNGEIKSKRAVSYNKRALNDKQVLCSVCYHRLGCCFPEIMID